MSEREQLLEEIKEEVRSAYDELQANQTAGCCHRLVSAFFMLTQFLEENYLE